MRSFLVSAILAAGTAIAAPPDDIRLAQEQVRALGIETRLLGDDGGTASDLPATVVVPNEQLRIVAAPLPGMVAQLLVATGESVKRGQPLARLSSPALLQAEREYLQAAQQAQLAAQQAGRDDALLAEGIIAASRAQASRTAQRQAAAALAEKRETLRLAGIPDAAIATLGGRSGLPGEVTVNAPIDGVVLEQSAVPGQRVEAAAPLFRIGRLQPLWLEIQTPADLAIRVRAGMKVGIAGNEASGEVLTVGRAVGAGSQTIMVRARIDRGTERLLPGQMVTASLQLPDDGAFRIPQAALIRHLGKTWIFVAEAGRFRPIEVTPSGQAGERVLVKGSALKAGMPVAVRGTAALKAAWLGLGREE